MIISLEVTEAEFQLLLVCVYSRLRETAAKTQAEKASLEELKKKLFDAQNEAGKRKNR